MPKIQTTPRPHILGLRRSAILETVGFLLIALVIDAFLAGNRFWDIEPHPFWAIVILVAAQYGTLEGLFAAVLSSLALLVGNMPEQTLDQDVYSYLLTVLKLPLLWTISALLLGELRERHKHERDRLREELAAAQVREEDLAETYTLVRNVKENFELRIASQLSSLVETVRAARGTESLDKDEIVTHFGDLVRSVLHPEAYSLFLLTDKGLEASLTHGWKEEQRLPRHYAPGSALYKAIVTERKVLAANKPEHESLLAGDGMIAVPALDPESGEVYGMLKVEAVDFLDFNLSTIQAAKELAQLLGTALDNAKSYSTVQDNSFINPRHQLYSSQYFDRYRALMSSLGKRLGFDVSLLAVRVERPGNLSNDERVQAARMLSDAVQTTLRSVDNAFDYAAGGYEFCIVLPGTTQKGAEIVSDKILKRLENQKDKGKNNNRLKFTTTIQQLDKKEAA